MSKKLLTTAEHLSSLDMLIAKKKEKKAITPEDAEIIIIILDAKWPWPVVGPRIHDYPPVLEKISEALVNVVKEASVDDLVQLRGAFHAK